MGVDKPFCDWNLVVLQMPLVPSCFAFLAGSQSSPASADKAQLLLQAGQCGQEHRAAAADWHAVFGPTEALDSPALFAALHQAFCQRDMMSFSCSLQTGREGLCKFQGPGKHICMCCLRQCRRLRAASCVVY